MSRNDLATAVAERRQELGLTHADIRERDGPSSPTILKIELGHKRDLRARTLQSLDAALGWPTGTSAKTLGHGDEGPEAPPADRIQDLRDAYDTLASQDGGSSAASAAADVLAYAIVPTLLTRIQRLQLDDLYALSTDDVLTIDDILTGGGSSAAPADNIDQVRTIVKLGDGRTISIKALRLERDLSQKEVCDEISRQRRARDSSLRPLSVPALSGIESGYRGPSPKVIAELESFYRLPKGSIRKQW